MKRTLKIFAVVTTIGMLFVLIGGALVTKTGSGAGCGDSWPLCHGELIPSNISFELIIELSHRLVSGTVGILVLILSIWSWKVIGHIRETKVLATLSIVFLVLQALIGAAAVMWGQSSTVLALHFGISLISFASVLLLTLLIFEVDKKFHAERLIIDRKMRTQIFMLTIYTYLVVYTGALVRHNKASLACPEWPLCTDGNFLLTMNMYQWTNMGHRLAAGILFIWIFTVTLTVLKNYKHQKIVYWGWLLAFIMISLQVTSGALIVFTNLNLYVALVHALFISCFFGILSYLLLLATRSHRIEKEKREEVA